LLKTGTDINDLYETFYLIHFFLVLQKLGKQHTSALTIKIVGEFLS